MLIAEDARRLLRNFIGGDVMKLRRLRKSLGSYLNPLIGIYSGLYMFIYLSIYHVYLSIISFCHIHLSINQSINQSVQASIAWIYTIQLIDYV